MASDKPAAGRRVVFYTVERTRGVTVTTITKQRDEKVDPAGEPTGSPIEAIAYRYNRPVLFYVLATVPTWVLWFIAAFISQLPDASVGLMLIGAILGLAGLVAPAVAAFALVWNKQDLRRDFLRRLAWPRRGSAGLLVAAALLLPLSVVVAQAISLLFGYGIDQFQLRGGISFTAGLLPAWVTLTLAPVLEELAWHNYGTDTLITRMRLLNASLLFTVIWTLWHVPLSFIKGYYQNELVQSGWLDALNFPLSMIAFVVLMNWLYFKTGRSILVAALFHLSANVGNELFMTNPDTKFIQTILLLVLAAAVVVRDRELFLTRPPRRDAAVTTS